VAREQLGTKRRFEQFEHLSSLPFSFFYLYLYFFCILIRAVVLTLRGFILFYSIYGVHRNRFSLPSDGSLRDDRLWPNHMSVCPRLCPMPPVSGNRVIFQLAFGVGLLHWTIIVPTCGNNLRIYSLDSLVLLNTLPTYANPVRTCISFCILPFTLYSTPVCTLLILDWVLKLDTTLARLLDSNFSSWSPSSIINITIYASFWHA
jgi:hypothetical protein